MKIVILKIIGAIYNIAFILVVWAGLTAFLYEILGHSVFDKVFSFFNVTWDLKRFCLFSFVFIFLWISTRILKEKLK